MFCGPIKVKVVFLFENVPTGCTVTESKYSRVGATPLLWFVNRSLGGDLRETHESKDVSISPDEVGSRKESERKRSEQGGAIQRPLPRCSNIPLDPSQQL